MQRVSSREKRRQVLQLELDAAQSPVERNRLGQFATPPELARQVARVALRYLRDSHIRFLEPAMGSGAFYSALLMEREHRRVAAALGFEVDPVIAVLARRLWAGTGLGVRCADFTEALPEAVEWPSANLILANPPYVRHHHLSRVQKVRLQDAAQRFLGVKVSGLTGLYVYFVLVAHRWMAEGAMAAWLIPTEWMEVNYGAALREYLTTRVRLLRVHRFAAADAQFGKTLVSSSVVFFKNEPPRPHQCTTMTSGTILAPNRTRSVPTMTLRTTAKWSAFFQDGVRRSRRAPRVTLGDLMCVQRGVATGGNRFFIRPRDEFLAMGIPREFLRPILPSSRHLVQRVIDRAPDGYPALDGPLALLDCPLPAREVRTRCPELWAYLDGALAREIQKRYLTRSRQPWYAQEQRAAAPVLAAYMGRGRAGQSPLRFFWNRSDALVTNSYLMLIPRRPLAELLSRDAGMGRIVWQFLCEQKTIDLIGHGRVYGGGLVKLEPRELGSLDATGLVKRLSGSLDLDQAIAALSGSTSGSAPPAGVEQRGEAACVKGPGSGA